MSVGNNKNFYKQLELKFMKINQLNQKEQAKQQEFFKENSLENTFLYLMLLMDWKNLHHPKQK